MPFPEEWLVGAGESALSSTSFFTRSATITETGNSIVLLLFTCAVYSHLGMFYIQVTESTD